jgi:hypothetical protein
MLNDNKMPDDDEALDKQLQEGGLPDGSIRGRAPPTLLWSIGTCKPTMSTEDTHYRIKGCIVNPNITGEQKKETMNEWQHALYKHRGLTL